MTLSGDRGRPLVLVVGVEPIVREWAQFKLAGHGFDVEQALDLSQAVRAIERRRPDVVLLDPDGYNGQSDTLLQSLCESASVAPVVVLSERTDSVAVNRAIRDGARGYLSKSSPNVELGDTLRTVMGGVLTLDQSSLRALVEPSAADTPGVRAALSAQELRVLNLVAEGLTNREIGAQIYLSPHTVKNYLRNAADKLGVATRLDAVLEASRRGLIEIPSEVGRSKTTRRRASGTLCAVPGFWALLTEPAQTLSEWAAFFAFAS